MPSRRNKDTSKREKEEIIRKSKSHKSKDLTNISIDVDGGNDDALDKRARKRQIDENNKHVSKFQLGELNSTLISTRRLTVGVKGLFGNAKSSRSVYRDIQERIQNRKLSNAVASEVELSLSRIVPARSKSRRRGSSTSRSNCDTSSSGGGARVTSVKNCDFETPGTTSTPFHHDTKRHSISSKCSTVRSVSSSSSSSASSNTPQSVERTPAPLQSSYVRIATSIRDAIPTLKPFKDIGLYSVELHIIICSERSSGKDLLSSLKKDLKKYHEEKHCLRLTPLYRKETSQPTPVLDEAPQPEAKRLRNETNHHKGNTSFVETTGLQEVRLPTAIIEKEPTSVRCQEENNDFKCDFAIPMDEKPDNQPSEYNANQKSLTSANTIVPFNETTNPSRISDFKLSSDEYFTDILQQPGIRNILDKPISSLRAPRRSKVARVTSSTNLAFETDFLDFIDSIPIDTLESQLLRQGSARSDGDSMETTMTATQVSSDILSFELQKPNVESPSPPKLYRMNMY